MKIYTYKDTWKNLLTPEIVLMLTQIHEYKGEQNLFAKTKKEELRKLIEIAKIQSTQASNRIEGINTSDYRLRALVSDKTHPKNRNEREIAGYRDVLKLIHENYLYIPVKPSIVLQLHRDLYKFEGLNAGGIYKTADNVIEEEDEQGNKFIRFKPVAAWETSEAMEKLCAAFEEIKSSGQVDMLLLIPMFILDFLCIHPFNDGNGRMSRLLTLLLLYREGYMVGKYVSLERLIENTKGAYYDCLQQSSQGWHENINAYEPFVKYMLGIILCAYREFSDRMKLARSNEMSKPDKVKEVIKNTVGMITKTEILEACPGISQITVQRTLAELLEAKKITKIGGGRYTRYVWNEENNR